MAMQSTTALAMALSDKDQPPNISRKPSAVPVTETKDAPVVDYMKMDLNYVSEEETAKVAEFRKVAPELTKRFSDRVLFIFLMGRKWDIAKAVERLTNFENMRKENEIPDRIKMDTLHPKILAAGHHFMLYDIYTPAGNSLAYMIGRKMKPAGISTKDQLRMVMWHVDRLMNKLPLRSWRMGVIRVHDMADMLSENQPPISDLKALAKVIQSCLPVRVNKIYAVDAGWRFRFILAIMKMILSAKLVQRIECIDRKTLLTKLPKEIVLTEMGGEYKFSWDDWLAQARKEEAEFDEAEKKLASEQKKVDGDSSDQKGDSKQDSVSAQSSSTPNQQAQAQTSNVDSSVVSTSASADSGSAKQA